MSMSRKDYVIIAKAIRQVEMPPEVRELLISSFTGELAADNQRFDRDIFIKAATPDN